jgi:NAD(P)-dependent dehydrogenase (short-subunit alcohol dehydrogenase family)
MVNTKLPLEGRVAIITGGSRGIGRATALAFADAGASVVVASRKIDDLEKVAEELRAKGVKALAVAAHVAKPEETKAVVDRTMEEFGKIDILVNNAGTNVYAGEMIDMEEWAWDTTMNVNIKGPFLMTQSIAKIMREQGGGCIINVASGAGIKPCDFGVYSVSKAAIIMLTEVLAKEWGKYKIRVNAIAPGIIRTRMSSWLWEKPEAEQHSSDNTALGRIGEPEDIAKLAVFLASDDASYFTGSVLVLDGGNILVGSPTPLLHNK